MTPHPVVDLGLQSVFSTPLHRHCEDYGAGRSNPTEAMRFLGYFVAPLLAMTVEILASVLLTL